MRYIHILGEMGFEVSFNVVTTVTVDYGTTAGVVAKPGRFTLKLEYKSLERASTGVRKHTATGLRRTL